MSFEGMDLIAELWFVLFFDLVFMNVGWGTEANPQLPFSAGRPATGGVRAGPKGQPASANAGKQSWLLAGKNKAGFLVFFRKSD